jgi:hypothetical protein
MLSAGVLCQRGTVCARGPPLVADSASLCYSVGELPYVQVGIARTSGNEGMHLIWGDFHIPLVPVNVGHRPIR